MKKIKPFIILHLILLMNSLGGICSKTAAGKPFLSFEFCLFYGIMLLILAVYALLWQQVLKMLPLNVAYANKSVAMIWGALWGVLFFNETITLSNIIGGVIVLAGVTLMVWDGEKKNE